MCEYFVRTESRDTFDSETHYWLSQLPPDFKVFQRDDPGIALPVQAKYTPTWAIGACAQFYAAIAKTYSDADGPGGHRKLVQADFNLARLNAWLRKAGKHDPNVGIVDAELTQAHKHVDVATDDLHDFMSQHDLLNPFSAALFFGTAIGSSGEIIAGGSEAVKNRISETEQVIPLSRFTFESAHFGWRGEHSWDASFGTHVGFQPVLNIVQASLDGEPSAKPAFVAVLQPGLVFDVGGRAGLPIERISGEFSVVGSVGANRLTTDPVTFDSKKPALIATQVSDKATKSAWFSETGVELTVFDNPVRVLHAEKGLVTPVIRVAGGYRYDGRFSDVNFPSLTADPNRLYFRAMIDVNKATSKRALADPAKTFDLGFGVEYERALHASSQVPSSTRFLIRGDINVLKAASGDDKKPAANKDAENKGDASAK